MKETGKNALIALAAAFAVTAVIGLGALRRVDKWAQDHLFQLPGAVSEDIVLIGIDEPTLEALGPYNTWGRDVMASALEALGAHPDSLPAVVAVDTLYIGHTDPQKDQRLSEAAAALPAVVTACMADFGSTYQAAASGGVKENAFSVLRFEGPYEALAAVTRQGHINAMLDQDGIMRHALLYVDVPGELTDGQEKRVYSMAWETAKLFLKETGRAAKMPPTDKRGHFYVPFTGKPGSYSDGYSLSALLNGTIEPDAWAGKIVLIGPYATALQDAYFTPISRSEQMYGVEIQANVIQSLLEENGKLEAPDGPQLAALFVLSFLAAWLFLQGGLKKTVWAAAALIVLGPLGALALYHCGFVTHAIWISAAILSLFILAVGRHYVLAAQARQRVTRTFERYVAPEIVQEILKEGTEGLKLGGSVKEIAVLFVDIRGFTSMSERLEPEKVVFILNQYLSMTSDCVEKNRGTLDKFVGDATMAFWGAPVPAPDAVYAAARTALDIVEGAEALSRKLKDETGEELRVGVGVHFGPAVVGNMGSLHRMDYTAIGDTVNTAARLEANAPGGTVYISRAVADALGSRASVTSLGGTVPLKGKAEGFEVLTLDALRV